MAACLICERHRADSNGICHNCNTKVDSMRNGAHQPEPDKYLTYRGAVVACYIQANKTVKPVLLTRSPESLPKSRTIDLNIFQPDYTREQIKHLKRAVFSVAGNLPDPKQNGKNNRKGEKSNGNNHKGKEHKG